MTPSTVAGVLMAIGTAVVVAGLHRQAAGLRLSVTDPGLALAMLRALRTTILGLAIVGGGLALARPPAAARIAGDRRRGDARDLGRGRGGERLRDGGRRYAARAPISACSAAVSPSTLSGNIGKSRRT